MKILKGTVLSIEMKDTIVVEVTRSITHPLYKKVLKRSKKYKVDAKGKKVSAGDLVEIVECKPISKDKHFKLKVENGKLKMNENSETGKVQTIDKTVKRVRNKK